MDGPKFEVSGVGGAVTGQGGALSVPFVTCLNRRRRGGATEVGDEADQRAAAAQGANRFSGRSVGEREDGVEAKAIEQTIGKSRW